MPKPFALFRLSAALLAGLWTAVAFGENLAEIYALALQQDPQLAAAQAAHSANAELRPQARALILPQLGAYAERSREDSPEVSGAGSGVRFGGSNDFTRTGVNLNQPLLDFGAFSLLRQSKTQLRAGDLTLAGARQALLLRAAQAYFDVLAGEDELSFARAEKEALARQLDQARKRFEVGFAPITDMQEAQARYDLALATEVSARQRLRSALEAIRALTSRLPGRLASLAAEIPLPAPEPQEPQAWVDRALRDNLQLNAVLQQALLAEEEVKRQQAGHYPTLDLTASYGTCDSRRDNTSCLTQDEASDIAVRLDLPLFAGGGTQSRVRQAGHVLEQRQHELTAVRRDVERQARDAYDSVLSSVAQAAAFRQAVSSNETASAAIEAGFKVGTRTNTDVLDAQRELYRARRDYARSRYEFLLNQLRLEIVSGQADAASLARINQMLAPAAAPRN
ncbi:MAG: TolC family outer membrane protein [Nevskiales bacterium]